MLASGWVGLSLTVTGTFERLALQYTDIITVVEVNFEDVRACHTAKSRSDRKSVV